MPDVGKAIEKVVQRVTTLGREVEDAQQRTLLRHDLHDSALADLQAGLDRSEQAQGERYTAVEARLVSLEDKLDAILAQITGHGIEPPGDSAPAVMPMMGQPVPRTPAPAHLEYSIASAAHSDGEDTESDDPVDLTSPSESTHGKDNESPETLKQDAQDDYECVYESVDDDQHIAAIRALNFASQAPDKKVTLCLEKELKMGSPPKDGASVRSEAIKEVDKEPLGAQTEARSCPERAQEVAKEPQDLTFDAYCTALRKLSLERGKCPKSIEQGIQMITALEPDAGLEAAKELHRRLTSEGYDGPKTKRS